jgi:hypothetical protein
MCVSYFDKYTFHSILDIFFSFCLPTEHNFSKHANRTVLSQR